MGEIAGNAVFSLVNPLNMGYNEKIVVRIFMHIMECARLQKMCESKCANLYLEEENCHVSGFTGQYRLPKSSGFGSQ